MMSEAITDQQREDDKRTREMKQRWVIEKEMTPTKIFLFGALMFINVVIPVIIFYGMTR